MGGKEVSEVLSNALRCETIRVSMLQPDQPNFKHLHIHMRVVCSIDI